MAATIGRWIAELTSRIDKDLLTDFFLTYRCFLKPIDLCQLLMTRFEWALHDGADAEATASRRIIRVRTYVVWRHWLLNYFHQDFVPNRDLRIKVTAWLNQMARDGRIRRATDDLRLVKSLKKVVKRLKAAYFTISAEDPIISTALLLETRTSAGRSRSATKISATSLEAVAEESANTASIRTSGESDVRLNQVHTHPRQATTSSSEDDVDLNIEIDASTDDPDGEPRLPRVIPISPLRPRQVSPKTSKISPRFPADRSSSLLATLSSNDAESSNRLSRYLTSTVGSIGRLRKIVRSRTLSSVNTIPVAKSKDSRPVDISAEDIHRHNEFRDDPLSHRQTLETPSESVQPGSLEVISKTPEETVNCNFLSDVSLNSSDHAGDISSAPSASFSLLGPALELDVHEVHFDDCDSSDSDSELDVYVPHSKKLRRLPAARNLRNQTHLHDPLRHHGLLHRHSIDTISSYATNRVPSIALQPLSARAHGYSRRSTESLSDASITSQPNVVPFFVPPVDSDNEELGDVAAALRRLEGQVDLKKQEGKAKKVEDYLKRSEEAKEAKAFPELMSVTGLDGNTSTPNDADLSGETEYIRMSSEPPVSPERPGHDRSGSRASPPDKRQKLEAAIMNKNPNASSPPGPNLLKPHQASTIFKLIRTSRAYPAKSQGAVLVAPTSMYRSFIHDFRTVTLAKHFCIIERDLLENVAWQDLLSESFRKPSNYSKILDWKLFLKERARNLAGLDRATMDAGASRDTQGKGEEMQIIILRFNLMCSWIESEGQRSLYLDTLTQAEICLTICSRANSIDCGTSSVAR